jgi:predicted Zn-dependent protease
MQERIEQFKKMAEADPNNKMGHFSLGKAYFDAGQFEHAVAPLKRTLELNPTYSKAYQLLGEAQAKTGDREQALATLTTGFKVADERGDRMPRDAMARVITELGGTPARRPAAIGCRGGGGRGRGPDVQPVRPPLRKDA